MNPEENKPENQAPASSLETGTPETSQTPNRPRRPKRNVTKVKKGNIVVKIYYDAKAGPTRKRFRVQWQNQDGTIDREMFNTFEEAETYAERVATDLNNAQRPYTKEEIDRLFELDARIKG